MQHGAPVELQTHGKTLGGGSKAHLVFLDVVLTSRVGLSLAIDSVILMPAATMVACGTLISQVAKAPVHQIQIFSTLHIIVKS